MGHVKKVLIDFAFWTSSGGLPNIGRAKSKCMGAFWLIIWLVCLACFIYQMSMIIQTYFAHHVLVQTQLIYKPMQFPAVTICNLNPYKASKAKMHKEIDELMTMYMQSTQEILDPSRDKYGLLKMDEPMERLERARDVLQYIVANYPDQIRQDISYELNDMILSCSFGQKACDGNNFTQIYDPIYGRCFTFNTEKTSEKAGSSYGLRLFLKTDIGDYLETSDSMGVRVTITTFGEPVFPDSFGHNAQTGFTTLFALKYLQSTRLPYPFSNCTDNEEAGEYSSEECFRDCLQMHVIKECGCQDPSSAYVNGTNTTFCDFAQADCVVRTTTANDSAFDTKLCECPPLCEESTFEVAASTSNWPSQAYKETLCSIENMTCDYYEENTLFLEFYYEQLNYQALIESEAYPVEVMISDIGGTIGLWLGVSVISLVEFWFLPMLLWSALFKKDGPSRTKHVNEFGERIDNEFDRIGGGHPLVGSSKSHDPYSDQSHELDVPPRTF